VITVGYLTPHFAGDHVVDLPAGGSIRTWMESPTHVSEGRSNATPSVSDEHPDLVDEVIAQSEAIERAGIRAYAEKHDVDLLTPVRFRDTNTGTSRPPVTRYGYRQRRAQR